jgi:hypothetical protein
LVSGIYLDAGGLNEKAPAWGKVPGLKVAAKALRQLGKFMISCINSEIIQEVV